MVIYGSSEFPLLSSSIKIKVDDLLYLKFGMTENQIRYLIFEYSLMDDKEVKSINDKICKYEEMLYLQ